jgi:hypothetical protein
VYFSIPAKPVAAAPSALADETAPKTILLLADGTTIELPSGATKVIKAQPIESQLKISELAGVLAALGYTQSSVETTVETLTTIEETETKASLDDSEKTIERSMLRYLRGQ